jgi:signal peptidase I
MNRSLRWIRRGLLALWIALIGMVLALVLTTHLASAFGYRLVIIRGSSMTPEISLGALAFEQAARPADIAPGQVATITLPSGTVVTHRITRVATLGGQVQVATKGDANLDEDPTLQPASAVSGVVRFTVPIAGYLLAFLGLPSGMVSVISMLGSLLAVMWLLEELEDEPARAPAPAPTVQGHGATA